MQNVVNALDEVVPAMIFDHSFVIRKPYTSYDIEVFNFARRILNFDLQVPSFHLRIPNSNLKECAKAHIFYKSLILPIPNTLQIATQL